MTHGPLKRFEQHMARLSLRTQALKNALPTSLSLARMDLFKSDGLAVKPNLTQKVVWESVTMTTHMHLMDVALKSGTVDGAMNGAHMDKSGMLEMSSLVY